MTPAQTLTLGPLGRLGRWTAGHFRLIAAAWVVIAVGLGVLAPRAEHALSGAGWEATGSESVQARGLIDRHFDGAGTYGQVVVIHARHKTVSDPAFARVLRRVRHTLQSDVAPSISPDRHAAVLRTGATRNPRDMVRAADELKGRLAQLGSGGVEVDLTGAPAMWSDFNQANKSAMLKSELISWPVTLAILVLAFGSLVAAGLPLMLTIAGLVAAAGSLWIGTRIGDISIWSMNFALMFALALGIDYALFITYRFRGAFFGSPLTAEEAVATTMDTAGKAVLFSGLTVLISLSAVLLVPSPAFRSTSLGIMLSVVFVLAAALTLLPAVLARLGPRLNRFPLPWVQTREHHSPRSVAWAERLWRRPLPYGVAALALLVALAWPVLSLKTAMPSIKVVPPGDHSRVGYDAIQKAFGPGATGPLQIVAPRTQAARIAATARRDPGIATVMAQPGERRSGARAGDPDDGPGGSGDRPDDRPAARPRCPGRRSSAGRWRRATTWRRRWRRRRRW